MIKYRFYQYEPKVFSVRNVKDFQIVLHQTINCNVNTSLYKIEISFKTMENNVVIAYADISYSKFALIHR